MTENNTTNTTRKGATAANKKIVKEVIRLKTQNPNMTMVEIGKIVGRDKSTILRTLQRYNVDRKKLESFKDYRADLLAGVQDKMLESIANEDFDKVSLRDKTVSFGIIYDKERLERGLSTQNTALSALVEKTDKEYRQKIKQEEVKDITADVVIHD
jgi:hypothetical protein